MERPTVHTLTLGRFLSLVGVILGVTIATGFVYGNLTQRWGPPSNLVAAAKHLQTLPTQIGDWQMRSEEPIGEAAVQMLSCAGYVNREYVNAKTGQTVSIAIIVGPPGPIAVHTPEICYSSRAYAVNDPRHKTVITDRDGRAHTFWAMSFRSTNPYADRLRVNYAWTSNGTWGASESPRFEFAGERALFKLQIASVASASSASTEKASDACEDFLIDLMDSGWHTSG